MKQIAIIGLGRFGMSLARSLTENKCQVLAVDSDMERVKKAQAFVAQAAQLDAKDEDSLKAVGVTEMDATVVAIGADIESSMLATMTLKDMGVPRVIVKASSELHGRFLKKIGADQVVFPEGDSGRRLGIFLAKPGIIEQIDLGEEYGIFEINVPDSWIGKTLGELQIRVKYGITILAIRSQDADGEKEFSMIISPLASEKLKAGDVVTVLGHVDEVKKLIP
ncbi:MAG: TrkA family potassium uptake protein [Deltaproteobacteria bacterium]|nr:TrkA family potassium uptake protein [Deltaproteobacteria bacterium]